eukprot:CAMPEP_0178685080 /NCGR_PEP_ID=MMETSP0699-20121125/3189_1 /TAXON_ID=265572 /ORGANISM="Extubocellulus spinifer, Strain CCMP396" /LENGTH=139 /DNA_ID=CAMNT_0020329803 /DNA_START=29 /DNA_END=448 /DNA_ORIENTATION=+
MAFIRVRIVQKNISLNDTIKVFRGTDIVRNRFVLRAVILALTILLPTVTFIGSSLHLGTILHRRFTKPCTAFRVAPTPKLSAPGPSPTAPTPACLSRPDAEVVPLAHAKPATQAIACARLEDIIFSSSRELAGRTFTMN